MTGSAGVVEPTVPDELPDVVDEPVALVDPVPGVLAMPFPAAVEPTRVVEPAVGLAVASEVAWLGAVELLVVGPVEPVVGFVATAGELVELVADGVWLLTGD